MLCFVQSFVLSESYTMRVLLSTDQRAQDWCDLLRADGHTFTVLSLGVPAAGAAVDVCLVLTSTPAALRSQCFWLATLTLPMLLITPALISAQALCRRLPAVRVICHPSRAAPMLGELLLM